MGTFPDTPVSIPDVYRMSDEEIKEQVLKQISLKAKRKAALSDSLEKDLNLDSLAVEELLLDLGDTLPVNYMAYGFWLTTVEHLVSCSQVVLNHPNQELEFRRRIGIPMTEDDVLKIAKEKLADRQLPLQSSVVEIQRRRRWVYFGRVEWRVRLGGAVIIVDDETRTAVEVYLLR
jgi:hypothetical protein